MKKDIDINYASFYQVQDAVITTRYTGSEPIVWSGYRATVRFPDDSDRYDDMLKFSQCVRCTIDDMIVPGGSEDCIDVTRGSGYTFDRLSLIPKGQYGMTIKGGVSDVLIRDVMFENHAGTVEIDLGNWSDYDYYPRPKVRNVVLDNVRMRDGSPVRVRLLHAQDVTVTDDSKIKIIRYHPFFVAVFFWTKRFLGKVGLGKRMHRGQCAINPRFEKP